MSTASDQGKFETTTGVLWDDPEAGKTWVTAIVGIIILTALMIALSVIFFQTEQREVDIKVIEPEYVALKEMKASQADLLASKGSYSLDIGGQPVKRERIPVADAIKLMAADPALAVPSEADRAAAAKAAPQTAAPVTTPAPAAGSTNKSAAPAQKK